MIDVTCGVCHKPYKAYNRRTAKDGLLRCEECALRRGLEKDRQNNKNNPNRRNNRYVTRYGITLQDYTKRLEHQKGCCAICGKYEVGNLSVDHNHSTGKVRGLLCQECNRGLGSFKDKPALLRKAAEYLESNDG